MPIVLARKKTLFSALGLSFLSLLLQVQIPNLLNSAVNNSLQHHTTPLSHYVRIVFVLAVAAGLTSYAARLFLMRTAYGIESDLRNMIYTHLTRMSFDFYDRVQSGQLISRANSDIRSVQMYLTFGPNILVQCSIAVVAFIYMLTINVPLAFVAMCDAAVRVPDGPANAPQPVPGLVADPVAPGGGRDDRRREHQRRPRRQVVRRRAARAATRSSAPPTSCSGPTSRTPTCARASRRSSRTCRRSGWP